MIDGVLVEVAQVEAEQSDGRLAGLWIEGGSDDLFLDLADASKAFLAR